MRTGFKRQPDNFFLLSFFFFCFFAAIFFFLYFAVWQVVCRTLELVCRLPVRDLRGGCGALVAVRLIAWLAVSYALRTHCVCLM